MKKKEINLNDKFLVAGAGGMVGSAICKALKEQGYGNEKDHDGKIFSPKKNELNYLDYEATCKWFEINKPTVVIIAAAKVGGILANKNFPTEFLLDNLTIQNNLISISYKFKVKKLLFLGSSCIYPKLCQQPIKEEYLMSGGLEPTNESYAVAKITGIKLCEALNKQYNFNSISLMPTNLYGPGDNYHPTNSHVLPSLIRKFHEAKKNSLKKVVVWGSGKPYREFLHVDDLAKGCIFALENWNTRNITAPKDKDGKPLYWLNIGTGIDISIKDLVQKIAKEFIYEGQIVWDQTKPDGTPRKRLDISKIYSMGWEPKISLEEGIKKTVSDYIFLNK